MSVVKKFSKNKKTCQVTFTLPKEAITGAKEVLLVGEFNNWNIEEGIAMVDKKDEYKTMVTLEAGRNYEYRFLIDGQKWENDWNAEAYVPNTFGTENSVVTLPIATTAKKTTKAKAKTKKVTATPTTKDNLKKIEGIGPKIEKLLNAEGIMTFADLANTKIAVLRKVLADAGSRYKMHDPKTWAKQSKMAAKGDWDQLTEWQGELKGGK